MSQISRIDIQPARSDNRTPGSSGPRPVVYLAEASPDLEMERRSVVCELTGHGYRVVAEGDSVATASQFPTGIEENIARSGLAIHLIGEEYGPIPAGLDS